MPTISDERSVYADDLPLVELFGDTARARLLSVFATKRDREFTITELAEETGLTRKSVYEHIDDLAELGPVEAVDAGAGTRYRTAEHEVAQKCHELSGVTLRRLFELEGTLD